jgi:hypothetical protein
MASANAPGSRLSSLLEAAFLSAVILLLRGYVWPTLSSNEVVMLQSRLEPTWFTRDFFVQESLSFTPRFYFFAVILGLAHAGLPLAAAYFVGQFVAVAAIATGLRAVARELGLGHVAGAAFVVGLLTVSVGTLGDTYFYTHAPVPAVWAAGAVAWAAALALRGRWAGAFALCGVAGLLQFLVGFYSGLLLLPAWWRFAPRRGPAGPALWVAGLALVYLPMRFSGGIGTGGLSGADYVTIYAYLRHPHHVVPSTWNWAAWVQAAVFYAGAAWFLHKHPAGRPAGERFVLGVTLGLTVLGLLGNWLFVEVRPVGLMATLQPGRLTPFAQAVVLALLASRVQVRAAGRDWAGAALLALIPFSLFPGFLLAVAGALPLPAQRRWSPQHAILAVAVLLAFQPFDASIAARGLRYGLWAGMFLALATSAWLAARPARIAAAAVLAVAALVLAARASVGPEWSDFLMNRFAYDARPTDPIGKLGARFARNAPLDALVLNPPASESWTFRVHSHRALIVDDKDMPHTEHGMAVWRDRVGRVVGTPYVPGLDLNAAWAARRPEELAAVAREFGAGYILTHDAWHPQLPGTPVDREAGWTLWRLSGP